MFKKLEILLGFILIVIAGLFISCNVNPFFGVGVEVDLEEPKLAVTSHISGDFVNSSFTISGTCRDNKGVVKVQIQLNGTNPLVTWDATIEGNTIEGGTWVRDLVFPVDAITNTREGDKLLDIFAYDERGNRAQTRMYLTVDDDSPTVTITDPILKTPEFFNQLIASDASSDFINLEYFSNGILQIKGYADDTFIINSTKLDIYDSEDLTTSVKSVTIKKDRALPAEAGENSFPSKFTFNIDTTGFTNNRAYLVSVSTEDMAGNKNSQTSMGYFYLDQDKDRPNGKISSPSGSPAITFPQSTASGTIWDDDGLSGYYWYLGNVDTNTANFKSWKTPKGYNAEGSSIVVTDEVAWGYVDLSSDVPPKILSWQMVTANEKGTFYMYIVPVDVNGLTPVVPISKMFVQKTSDAPTLSIISPDSRTTQRGEIKVALNATGGEDKKVTLLSYRIEGIVKYPSDLSSDYQKINVIGDTDSNGNLNGYVIPIDSLLYVNDVSHDIKLSVYCTNDNSEDSRILDFYLRADNDGPKVKIDNPVANSGLNGKVTVSGTAEDDYSGVKTLYFGYFDNGVMTNALLDSRDDAYDFIDSSSDTTLSNITLASHNRWHKVVFSQAAWSYEFDTTKLPDGNNRFYVAAADAMGNVGYTSVVYLIDQELDKPNATITIPQNDGDVMFPQSVATGEASDDDGLGYIYWFIGKTSINFGGGAGEPTSDYASWGSYAGSNASAGRIDLTANNPKAYSWQLTTPKGTGDYKIHILPVDMNGVAASAKTVKSFTQKSLDKPVLKIDGPDPKNTYNGNVTLTFSMNAGEGKILDRIYIKIENDNTVDLVIPGSVGLINGYTYTFDITKYVDANNHDVSISAYCSNTESDKEYSAVATLNLKADNWAPTVVISGPAANSGLNGSAIISGTAQDDWSGVKTLYFGYFKTPPADLTPDYNTVSKLDAKASADIGAVNGINVFWHKVGFTQAAWSYGYNTNKITTTIHNDYKLYVAAVDAMGNVGWSSAIYDINQDLDKPGARILAPTEGSSTFPRSVASGDATDDDGLDYIYYYIGKSNVDPGVYTSWGDVSTDDAKSGRIDLSATAPTVAAWKIDQTPGDTGEFTIHIVPVDKFGTAGIKRTLTYTQNTSSTPQVQIVSPNPSINNKGDIVVSIRATAGGEFKVAAIKYDLSSDIKSDFDEVTILDPGTWGAVVDYSLPAFDSTLFTNNAVHDIIVDVWCVNSNGDESQKTRTYLKADNVAPANSITNPAEGEGMNGIWPVYGSISDDWSGVDALYFSYYKGAEPASSTYDTLAKIEAKASENLSEVDGTTKIWHKVDFTQAAWSYDFDTEIITSGAKSYKLIVASVDKVGNVGWVSRTYNIDQELDYPHSKIIIPLANGNTFPQSVVSAEASDDDGVAKVFWRIKLGDPEGIGDPDLTTGWGTSDPTNDMSGIIDVDGSPRSYPFQLNTPKGDGKFTIYTQTYDVNGKLQKVATTRTYYQYASNDPHIQVKSPTNLSQTFTGAMKVVVRASGGANYNVNSLKYRITSDKPFDSGLKDATITVGNIVDATIDINTATYTSASVHDIKVEIYCVNEKGVSSSVTTLNLKADNTAPTTLNISSPDAGSGLNGLAVISGAVQDDWSGIDALYFGYFASMTDAIMNSTYNTKAKLDAAVADKTLGKWSKVSAPTAAWSYSFDTTKITSTQANPYNLYVAAVDKVGNVKYTSRSFFIDQDLDIPGSCVNIPTAADITFSGSTANGEATDDDGLARLHYYIGTAATPTPAEPNAVTGWGATTGDGSNDIYGTITIDGTPKSYPWSIKTPTGQGEYHIYLWSVDEHNVMQATPTKRTYSQFASRMPTVNIIGLSASDTYGGEVDLTFDAYGGANFNVTEIEYRIYSTHNYDLTWKVIDVADAKIVSEGLTFDTSLYTDADCHTITIEVKCTNDDGSGATSNVATFSVKADNTPPNIEITNPNSGSKLNGLATIMGTSTDDWSGVKAIYIGYFADMTNALMDSDYSTEADLSADTRAVPTLGKWIKISPTAAWSYQFNTTVIGNDSSYPLYVAAVDNKGNVKYTSRTFDVDQDSDRPTINILAPLDGSTVTPQSAVTGNAIDDDGVRYIYVYIVKSGHATYDNPPDDYTTWGNTHNNDVSGCIIDLSSKNSPINYSWTAITPNNSATYKVYAFAADKNTPTDYNSSPRLYSQRSSTYYVSSAYDVIEIIQKTTDTPSISVLTNPSTTYMGDLTIDVQATGGGAKTVKSIGYRISSTKYGPTLGTLTGVSSSPGAGQFLIAGSVSTSFNFDTSLYTSDTVVDVRVDVWVTNEDDVSSQESTVYYRADNTKPVVTISSPGAGTTINGNQYISGTANDWSQVEALYFGYFASANAPDMLSYYTTKSRLDADSILSTLDPAIDKWHKVESPSINWSYVFRTEEVTTDIDAGFKLYVAAVDKVGNVNYAVRAYTIDQDMDKPMITITNPGYSGAEPAVVRNDGEMAFIPRTYVMMGTVQDGDQDGIRNVHIDIDILANNGDHSADVYPPNASGDTGDGYNNVSSIEPMILGDTPTSWTYKISNYALSLPGEFYRVRVRPIDAHGKLGLVRSSYFVVTNVAPEVEIISPSILDPDTPEATNPDVYGTVISNVKDDIYWDADPNNNLIYYDDDSNRRNWGWNTDLFEESFNIFNNTVPGSADATRSNYYRMIFRAKDNGRINTVEISVDGGANTAAELSWSGGITSADGHFNQTIHDSAKIKAVDVMKRKVLKGNYFDYTYENMDTTNDATSDWVYFFVDIDTTKLSPSAMLKVTVGDNNDPSSYETTASVQVNVDNSAPTGSILNWGIDSLTEKHEFSKTGSAYQYIAGDLSDFGSAGVRYANLYFWNNMQPDLDATPNYKENGSGLITVDDSTNVPSGVHKVSIPENLGSVLVKNLVGDIGDVDPASSDYDNYPNNWIRAYKYLSSGWRIKKIYTNDESPSDADGNPGTYYGISTKYGSTYPSDGKKLICLEIVDNAGNKLRKFYEHTFSEYPPTVLNANISSAGRPEEAVTDETTAGRKWISQTFSMNGFVRDYVAGTNPNPGIERVRVYIMKDDNGDGVPESTQKIYTSKTSDTVADPKYSSIAPTVVIDTTADISAGPTSTDAQVEWGIDLAQSIAALADGNYMIMVEVRDKTGSTDTMKQYVYIDNSDPTLVVSQPTAAQVVKGDMFAISGTASDVAGGGFDAGCINIKILDGVTVKREWNASLDPLDVTSPYDWSQEWSLISDASDDFDESETRIVRVTLTDKSGNTVTATDITVTKGAPPSWPTFTANGSSTAFANATFKSKYATIGASDPLFMIKGSDSVFTTNINDTTQFTSAKLIVNGYKQSDGSLLNSGNTPALADKSMNIKTGNLIVGENDLGVDDVYTYAGLPDGEYAYKVELHQEAAVINMQKYFIVDNTKPNIWVKKIENTDFNGYGTSTLNGHVDASHDNWGAGYTTGADAVSGVIQLQVKVKDNYLLKNIKAKMTSYSFGTGDNTDVILLQRDASGVWGTPASRGALGDLNYFAVKDVVQSLGTDYDYVVFTLEFNTANLTGVAGINKTLQFTAEDWVGNTTNEAGTNKGIEKAPFDLLTYTSSMSLTYAKPVAFTLDVVPYISGLTTGLESGTLSFVKRSSTGKYPIKYSTSTTDLLRISGYNLGSASAPTIAIGTVSPTIQTRDSAKYTWVDIRKNATKSGLLSVSTGTIVSTNNINDNDLPTNEETATYFPDRDDNRYVAIWQIATSAYSGKTEAVMKPNSGRTDMDWMYVNNSQTVYLNATSLATSWTLAGGDFTYNSAGTFNYIFLHNMNWSGGSDSYQVHGSVQWGINEGTTVGAYNWHRASTSRLGLGNLSFVDDTEYNYTGGDDKVMDRYKNLQIINNGNNTDTDVFVAYFDKSSITRSIVFWSFKVGTGVTNTTTMAGGWYANIEKITAGNTAANYSSSTNLFTGLKTPYVAGARRRIDVTTVASGKDSEHFDMKYYSNRVYLTYYDETSMALKFKYCSDPINAPQTWSSDLTVDTAAGLYVKTVVDPAGGIHMAYYDNSYSQLKYAYLTSYADTSADVYTVDALFTTGMYNAINIRDFDTSAGTDYRPIISTYSISYAGTKYSARVAYPTTNLSGLGNGADPSTNEYTGKWEVITVCSANAPGQSSTFIETDATANYNGQILVGYNGAYIEEATLLSE